MSETKPYISVVAPAYNEELGIEEFYNRTKVVLEKVHPNHEIVLVNDGSKDNTLAKLVELHKKDSLVKVVNLSRNFGKEIALTAALDQAQGKLIVPIDSDLQDPPELIPKMIEIAQQGYDVVYAVRSSRKGETGLKKLTSFWFYRIMRRFTGIDLPRDTGDFRLMNRKVVDALKDVKEYHRFMKGLFTWVGFKQVGIKYDRDARYAGETKWNYFKLFELAFEGITSFSYLPLRLSSLLGFIISIIAFVYGIIRIIDRIINGTDVAGYPSLLVIILFLGGVQLITIGLIGEYVGRIYNESKKRPLYIISEIYK